MLTTYRSERLLIESLKPEDLDFIFELVNTTDWIRFIGDRNIRSRADAAAYVDKILLNSSTNYWVVKLLQTGIPTGIVTLIKRDYLDCRDIGFAFLPAFMKQGYAAEASRMIIADYFSLKKHKILYATTMKDNTASLQLLDRLGFVYDRKFNIKNEELLLYALHNQQAIL